MRTTIMTLCAAAILAATALPACGHDETHDAGAGGAGDPMTATVTALGTEIGELEALATAHDAAVAGAADLAAAVALEAQYETDGVAEHHALMALLDHMAMCMKDGVAPPTDDMMMVLDEMEMELHAHKAAMDAAADLTAALAEEDRHQGALAGQIGEMHTEHEAMASTASSYMCPAEHH